MAEPQFTGRELEQQARNVFPGAWIVETERPVATLLGSCVSVCLYDPGLKLGGMNHFMLPEMSKRDNADTDMTLSGNYAMEALLNAMLTKGAKKARLTAKAFGGGAIIKGLTVGLGIGERNVAFAREWLAREHIPIAASDFLGPWSRKVVFDPRSGDAFCRRMSREDSAVDKIASQESAYQKSLITKPKKADIELF
jgi:chemotaxis protein CheD